MRTTLSLTILILLAAGLATAAAARHPALSWGKPGVSYADYRADATSCLRVAAGADLTGTEPAEALVLASRRIETALTTDFTPMIGGGSDPLANTINTVNAVQQARMAARPDLRLRQARDILQTRLDHCLEGHGYRRFRLTDDQRRQLDRFHLRQPERQVYLHSLASDPQILASQAAQSADISSRGR
jgi:hypothetical protein